MLRVLPLHVDANASTLKHLTPKFQDPDALDVSLGILWTSLFDSEVAKKSQTVPTVIFVSLTTEH